MNEPRVYKNSPFVFGLLLAIFAVLFVAIFFASGDVGFSNLIVMIPFALMFAFLFIFVAFTATAQTIISNDEISTKNLLGTKSVTVHTQTGCDRKGKTGVPINRTNF